MAELDISSSDITNISPDAYSVDNEALDPATNKETVWDFPDATTNLGYYKNIPEFKKSIDILATWVVGKGYEVEGGDMELKQIIEHLSGWGEDTAQSIFWNMVVMKKVCGDSFAEIMEKDGVVINLKPISPERMRVICGMDGRIKRYEITKGDGMIKKIKKEKILHLCNDRVGDEIHGTPVLDASKWMLDALHEALTDERMLKHRDLALGILYYDGEDTTKRDELISYVEKAYKNGQMLVLPKDVATIEAVNLSKVDRLAWINFLTDKVYQAVGVPKILVTSDNMTEMGGKMGHVMFEPIYVREQTDFEADLWNQMAWKIKFNRPPSLGGMMQENEEKNTGQLGFQPNDVEATLTPE